MSLLKSKKNKIWFFKIKIKAFRVTSIAKNVQKLFGKNWFFFDFFLLDVSKIWFIGADKLETPLKIFSKTANIAKYLGPNIACIVKTEFLLDPCHGHVLF